jgi:hypothetical protein
VTSTNGGVPAEENLKRNEFSGLVRAYVGSSVVMGLVWIYLVPYVNAE